MSAKTSATQVLEFDLGAERYCVGIEYVSQIVERQDVTQVPNAPAHVEGVADIRGRTTTIVDPKASLSVEEDGPGAHLVVFDDDAVSGESAVAWRIDSVHRVVEVDPDDVDETAIGDGDGVEGLINRGDEFVVWVEPPSELESSSAPNPEAS